MTHLSGHFRRTTHIYKIQFASTTSVRSCEDFAANVIGLKLVNFGDIYETKCNPDFFSWLVLLPYFLTIYMSPFFYESIITMYAII